MPNALSYGRSILGIRWGRTAYTDGKCKEMPTTAQVGHVCALSLTPRAAMPDDQPMARQIIENITDDIDGSADAQAVEFSYGGTDYTLDLGKKNRAALEKALKPYIQASTKVSKRVSRGTARGKTRRRRSGSSGPDLAAVRAWAAENGYQVSSRGRISGAVLEAYQTAQ